MGSNLRIRIQAGVAFLACAFAFIVVVGVVGCSKLENTQAYVQPAAQTPPPTPESEAHKRSAQFAMLATKADYALHYDESVKNWKLALKEEPDSRSLQESLAFTLWRAHRLKEAIPIWKRLSTGDDDTALRSKNFLSLPASSVPKSL